MDWRELATAALTATLLTACQGSASEKGQESMAACTVGNAAPGTRVLVFSRTTGFRHESIPAGVAAVTILGSKHGFVVEHTEDPTVFADTSLAKFKAVVFLNTTGDVLDSTQQAAFERYIRAGNGYVGVHSAADTEYDWPWYGQLVGAYFKQHPAIAVATVNVVDSTHVSTRCLPRTWSRTDEWYDYRAAPPAGVSILAMLDEATYQGATMGPSHPIAWYHEFDGGRAWYTGMGHTNESFAESPYLDHLAGGIVWASTRP